MTLAQYSIGIGDRFGVEGEAQLAALTTVVAGGVPIVPVWNKSNREHTIIGTTPADARRAAEQAVRAAGWNDAYHVDADHIGLGTVDRFLEESDFFTIDVADFIGTPAAREDVREFLRVMARFKGELPIPGSSGVMRVTDDLLLRIATQYLLPVKEAGKVYRHIAGRKPADTFITEVSVDEAASPQTPEEMFFILAALAIEGIPVQTIAPKFTGAFLKGIDYVGDVDAFAREFDHDLGVITLAQSTFGLPASLKISIHSGSDKFSLYPIMHTLLRKHGAGVHLKTAGTTWLEEVIGLASEGGEGLVVAKEIYAGSFARYDELVAPYLAVVEIDRHRLPDPGVVRGWDAGTFVRALQHEPSCPEFNPSLRQLVHVGYKVAAEMGGRFRGMLQEHRKGVEAHVTHNILQRHLRPLFLGPGK